MFETPSASIRPFENIIEASYVVGDILSGFLHFRGVDASFPLIAASFVDIDDLTRSCTLGRIISEQIAGRLSQRGFQVVEIKLRQESVFVKKGEGEFFLSRDIRKIATSHDAHAVLVGTYAISEQFVFVSARVVRTSDGSVMASQDYEIRRDYIPDAFLGKSDQ